MTKIENLEEGKRVLYSEGYFSKDYNQDLYLKKTIKDFSKKERYYLTVFSNINGKLKDQGFIYFYLNHSDKTSHFIGVSVREEFRNLNIASFLVASWIDLCLNNGYNFLGTHSKQRKPFLLYLLKTYGFEILDKSLYITRPDVISICRSTDIKDNSKYLLFKDSQHEEVFSKTKIYKNDNYIITHSLEGLIHLDNIILPLQNQKKKQVEYELINKELAEQKSEEIITKHRR